MKDFIEKCKRVFYSQNPLLWVMLGLILFSRIINTETNPISWIVEKLYIVPGIIIGVTVHEAAHAYSSYWLGDPTPKAQGRLSLNPLRHFDALGLICLLLAGFGWGKAVQINPYFYKKRRRDEFIVSIAGVTTNFITAGIFSFIVKAMMNDYAAVSANLGMYILFQICVNVVYINLVLMVFNLIPCPPLDGWGIITQIFDLQKYSWWIEVYRRGNIVLLIIILFNLTSYIVSPVVSFLAGWMLY